METLEQKKKKLVRLLRVHTGGDVELLKLFDNLEVEYSQQLSALDDKITGLVQELRDELEAKTLKIKKLEGPEGRPGKDCTLTPQDEERIAQKAAKRVKVPVVEKIIEKTTEVVKEPVYTTEVVEKTVEVLDEKKFEDQLPKFGERIRDALELLRDDSRLDKTAIKGLEEELEQIRSAKASAQAPHVSPSGRDLFQDIDLSPQLDGVTKTFNLPAVWNIISVSLSSFPNVLRKSVDFTYTPTSITFTSQIDASTSLAAGQTCVLTVVTA